MSGSGRSSTINVDGYEAKPGEDLGVSVILAGPNYCETFGVPLLVGREFTLTDTTAGQKVAVVNKAFAEYFYGNSNPIGKQIHFGDDKDAATTAIENCWRDRQQLKFPMQRKGVENSLPADFTNR
jgi:hypothetical protein